MVSFCLILIYHKLSCSFTCPAPQPLIQAKVKQDRQLTVQFLLSKTQCLAALQAIPPWLPLRQSQPARHRLLHLQCLKSSHTWPAERVQTYSSCPLAQTHLAYPVGTHLACPVGTHIMTASLEHIPTSLHQVLLVLIRICFQIANDPCLTGCMPDLLSTVPAFNLNLSYFPHIPYLSPLLKTPVPYPLAGPIPRLFMFGFRSHNFQSTHQPPQLSIDCPPKASLFSFFSLTSR